MAMFPPKAVPQKDAGHDDPLVKRDAQIHVSVAKGNLSAYLQLDPPENGGSAALLRDLEKALSESGITFGIDREALRSLAAQPVYQTEIPIATGTPPVNGENGTIEYQFETGPKEVAPKINPNGTVDYRDLELANNVRQDQVLALISPPTDGTPGTSVRGESVQQKKGKSFPVFTCLGKNVKMREDGVAVLSKIDGQVELLGSKITVNETLIIRENVDLSTGNISAVGNVTVYGMVQPGVTVEAEGNVDVFGTVESAVIKAGGNIKLSSGITGSELVCAGDLKSRFIENCHVFVRGHIRAEYILHSSIRCGQSLKTEGSISKIIGGSCMVQQTIESRIIGSTANVKTVLQLGTDPAVLQRQHKLQALIPELEKQIESLLPLLSLLRKLELENRLTPQKQELLQKISHSYEAAKTEHRSARRELDEISSSQLGKDFSRVICHGTIYPGTVVTIGNANLTVTETINNASLANKEGEIVLGPAR